MAVGDLYTISELCDSWQAVYRWQACGSWQAVVVGDLYDSWQALLQLASHGG